MLLSCPSEDNRCDAVCLLPLTYSQDYGDVSAMSSSKKMAANRMIGREH